MTHDLLLQLYDLLQSQLQSVTPRRTRRKMSRKKMAPNTPYTMADVMEMETELSPPIGKVLPVTYIISLCKYNVITYFLNIIFRRKNETINIKTKKLHFFLQK